MTLHCHSGASEETRDLFCQQLFPMCKAATAVLPDPARETEHTTTGLPTFRGVSVNLEWPSRTECVQPPPLNRSDTPRPGPAGSQGTKSKQRDHWLRAQRDLLPSNLHSPFNPHPGPHGEFPKFNKSTKHKPQLWISLYSMLAQLNLDGSCHQNSLKCSPETQWKKTLLWAGRQQTEQVVERLQT